MKQYYVYILKCSDSSYYTGVTNNLERRFTEHQKGINEDCYTYDKRPVELVFQTVFNDITQAIAFEKQVKGWSRKKKEAIIKDQWEDLINFQLILPFDILTGSVQELRVTIIKMIIPLND